MINPKLVIGEGTRLPTSYVMSFPNVSYDSSGYNESEEFVRPLPRISQNGECYQISRVTHLGFEICLFKSSPEGAKLTELLEAGKPLLSPEAVSFIEGLAFKHLHPENITESIHEFARKCYLSGKQAKAAEIRRVLDIKERFL